jgi:GT2 family glycosyltransferase
MSTDDRVTAVVATRDRRCQLLETLGRLASLSERPALVVVDNGSSDRTAAAARSNHPEARVLELGRNLGAGARTEGVRLASTPYVAFSDDDSWWQSGALARAADLLDAYPRLALVAAKILVGAKRDADPACELMAASPLARDGLPGPAVMGFLACGAVVRRSAFLEVGGFDGRLGIGGEE